MRPLAFLAPALLALAACGDGSGTVYGDFQETSEPTLSVAYVLAHAEELNGKKVLVAGTVTDVCAKRGCWIKLGDETGPAVITFKVEDGVMVFPMDAKGQWAKALGTVQRFPITLEQTRERRQHEAEETGRPFDPASVTEPEIVIRLAGIGARVGPRR